MIWPKQQNLSKPNQCKILFAQGMAMKNNTIVKKNLNTTLEKSIYTSAVWYDLLIKYLLYDYTESVYVSNYLFFEHTFS